MLDYKIAQFNYKTLHLILPCFSNLKRWRIINYNLCPLCHVKHDVTHLLFFCIKAQSIWNFVNEKFSKKLSLFDIICGCNESVSFNYFISLVSFYIYKEWLILYKCNEDWVKNDIIFFVKGNIKSYLNSYKHCSIVSDELHTITEQFLL